MQENEDEIDIGQFLKEAPKPPEEPCLYDLLSEDQIQAWDAVTESLDKHSRTLRMFHLSGDAGTGKSFLISALTQHYGMEKVALMAPTGIAAQNIQGTTIHRFFGMFPFKMFEDLPPGQEEKLSPEDFMLVRCRPTNVRYNNRTLSKNMEGVKLVIIDEISMVAAAFLECLVWLLKGYSPVILFVGDFLQLPPVYRKRNNQNRKKEEKQEQLPETFGMKAFKSPLWYDVKNLHLSLNHRQQTDSIFLKALNDLRFGEMSQELYQVLYSRTYSYLPEWAPMLMSTRKSVYDANMERLHALGTPIVDSSAEVRLYKNWTEEEQRDGEYISDYMVEKIMKENNRIPTQMEFAEGARVVMLTNTDVWVNGSTGIIVKILESTSRLAEFEGDVVHILLDNGTTVASTKCEHQIYNASGKVIVRYMQFSFQLAWALTIHKCQGMTMDRVGIDLARQFETGMTYVAVSRCRSIEGLYFVNLPQFCGSPIRVDFEALHMEHNRLQGLPVLPEENRPAPDDDVFLPKAVDVVLQELDDANEQPEEVWEEIDDIPF